MSLSDVYVSHNIKGIFILVSTITSLGDKFIIEDKFCYISRNGDTIASACLKDRLFWLEMNPVDHSTTERIASISDTKIMDLHRRPGHISAEKIISVITNGTFEGIDREHITGMIERCSICCTAKSKRAKSDPISETKYLEPLQLIQVDR